MNRNIKVSLGERSYQVRIGSGLLGRSGALIRSASPSKRFVILTVRKVQQWHGTALKRALAARGARVDLLVIPDGEVHKNERTLFSTLGRMARLGLRRDSCLVALGGGVVGDLGGLAASLYMRGIDFIQCPTTLLSQVDASIGGKTAIDFHGVKNLIGAFYQPKMVLIDTDVLGTLPLRQLRSGLAEIIKAGVIRDEGLFSLVERGLGRILAKESAILGSVIGAACRIKAEIVGQDEKERGRRAWLNYGHTFGHALESYFRYETLTHGEAVAYGMWFASLLSHRMGTCSRQVVDRQRILLKRAGLFPGLPPFDTRKVFSKMSLDKKARNGRIQFILTRKIGLVTIQKNVPPALLGSAIGQFRSEAREL